MLLIVILTKIEVRTNMSMEHCIFDRELLLVCQYLNINSVLNIILSTKTKVNLSRTVKWNEIIYLCIHLPLKLNSLHSSKRWAIVNYVGMVVHFPPGKQQPSTAYRGVKHVLLIYLSADQKAPLGHVREWNNCIPTSIVYYKICYCFTKLKYAVEMWNSI